VLFCPLKKGHQERGKLWADSTGDNKMFNKLMGLIKNFKFGRDSINKTNEAQKLVIAGLMSTLFAKYQKEMSSDKAQVLSAQVINYLTGKDIDRAIMVSEEPLKSKIIAIKHLVKERALNEMNSE
jgi:hypothetical protein